MINRSALILVIDSNPITRNVVRRALGTEGFTVLEAGGGAEAIEIASHAAPDLIVQDLVLPDVDGFELVARLRAMPGIESIPILAYSGLLSRLEYGRAASLGFTDFLQKPVNADRLLQLVESHLPSAGDHEQIGRERRILIVDDSPVQLKLARFLLADLGFHITTAASATEGLAILRRGGIEAVLTDVLMPQPDGFRFCAQIRADAALAHLPVILMSSNFVDPADREVAKNVGASGMVERTPRLTEAIVALEHALSQPTQPTSVGVDLSDYGDRMLRQLDRQVALHEAAVRRAAMHASILTVIGGISETLARQHSLADILPDVLGNLMAASSVSRGALFTCDPSRGHGDRLVLATSQGFSDSIAALLAELGPHRVVLDRVTTSLAPLVLGTASSSPDARVLLTALGGATALLVPFVADGMCLGILVLVSTGRDLLEHDWVPFARSMGQQIGLAFALSRTIGKLAESENRYRRIVETANEGVWVIDASFRTTFVNARMAAMLGHEVAELMGRSLSEFLDAEGLVTFANNTVVHRERRPTQSEVKFLRRDGSELWAMLGSSPILDAEGRLDGLLAMVMDVTERRRAEAARRQSEARSESARKSSEATNLALQGQLLQSQKMDAVGRLAGGIAHDFNNLLSVILSYGEMLLEDAPPGPMREDLEEICRAGNRAATLTRQLLMFSRQQVIEPRVLDLNERLLELDKMLRRILGADVELGSHLGDHLGRVHVDPGGIEQVILNLIVNARDAMPTGGKLTIETSNVLVGDERPSLRPGVRPGRYVMLAVTDTGIGMDEETRARIFEPFFTTKAVGKGTGLGLATVFGIVEQFRGSIVVVSTPGRGARFEIYIPRVDAMAERDASADAIKTSLRGSETILLVEDDEQVRTVARTILRKHGYTVMEASNAGEAMLIAEGTLAIDLLLSDVVMPQMSGPELAKRLAKGRPAMKILCMSGYTDDSIVRHGVLEGELAFLQKPITSDTLTKKVRDLLDAPPTRTWAGELETPTSHR